MKVHIQIANLRKKLCWSQARLAYEATLSLADVRAIESGELRDERALNKLKQAFQAAHKAANTPLPFVVPDRACVPAPVVDKPLSAYQFSSDPVRLVEQIKALPVEERTRLKQRLLPELKRSLAKPQ